MMKQINSNPAPNRKDFPSIFALEDAYGVDFIKVIVNGNKCVFPHDPIWRKIEDEKDDGNQYQIFFSINLLKIVPIHIPSHTPQKSFNPSLVPTIFGLFRRIRYRGFSRLFSDKSVWLPPNYPNFCSSAPP